jgi:hypothetical protein
LAVPHGCTSANRKPIPVSTRLMIARTSTISVTGIRPFSCLTQTVIKLKASELRIRERLPFACSLAHQGEAVWWSGIGLRIAG